MKRLLLVVMLATPATYGQTYWTETGAPLSYLNPAFRPSQEIKWLHFADGQFRISVEDQSTNGNVVHSIQQSADGSEWELSAPSEFVSIDASARLQSFVGGAGAVFHGVASSSLFRGDPVRDQNEVLELSYTTRDGEFFAWIHEGERFSIPDSEHELIDPGNTSAGVTILSALWGSPIDATSSSVHDIDSFRGTTVVSGVGDGQLYSEVFRRIGNAWLGERLGDRLSRSQIDDVEIQLATGNGVLVMAPTGYYYHSPFDDGPFFATTDLINWEPSKLSPESLEIRSLDFLGDRFVATGSFAPGYSDPIGIVLSSLDGVDWSMAVFPEEEELVAAAYDTGWLVAGNRRVYHSADGLTWNAHETGTSDLISIAGAGGWWVLLDAHGGVRSSRDLEDWNYQLGVWEGVELAAGNGLFMVADVRGELWKSSFAPQGAVDIVNQPSSATILPGTTTLSVVAEGDGELGYQWFEGNAGDESTPVDGATASVFETPELTSDIRYWARVSNGFSEDHSNSVRITMAMQPVITYQTDSRTILMGENAYLSVSATGNGLSYQWYEGLPGDVTQPVQGKTSYSFIAPGETPGTRTYWLRASNLAGFADSAATTVEVLPVLPVFEEQPLDLVMYAWDGDSISANINGPGISAQWYYGESGDIALPVDGASSATYFLPDDETAGEFQYWLRLSNAAGKIDSRTVTVTVLPYPPVVYEEDGDGVFSTGGSTGLGFSSSPYNERSYQWYRGESGDISEPIDGATGSGHSVSLGTPGTQLRWVRVSNPFGSTDSRTYVVRVLPDTYVQWAELNGLPVDGMGLGAKTASAAGDGIPNYVRYGRGVNVDETLEFSAPLEIHQDPISGENFGAIWVVQVVGGNETTFAAQESRDLNEWAPAVNTGVRIDQRDGTERVLWRASEPMTHADSFYLRVEARP